MNLTGCDTLQQAHILVDELRWTLNHKCVSQWAFMNPVSPNHVHLGANEKARKHGRQRNWFGLASVLLNEHGILECDSHWKGVIAEKRKKRTRGSFLYWSSSSLKWMRHKRSLLFVHRASSQTKPTEDISSNNIGQGDMWHAQTRFFKVQTDTNERPSSPYRISINKLMNASEHQICTRFIVSSCAMNLYLPYV